MIKINLSPEKIKAIKDNHLFYADEHIKPNLTDTLKKLDEKISPKEYSFYEILLKNFTRIIIGTPARLKKLVEYDESNNRQSKLYSAYLEALDEKYSKNINKKKLVSEIDLRIKKITGESKNAKKSKDKLNTLKQNIESNSELSHYNSLCQLKDEGINKEVKKLEKKIKKNFNQEIEKIFNYTDFTNGVYVNPFLGQMLFEI